MSVYARRGVSWRLCKLVCNALALMPYWWCGSKSTYQEYAVARVWLSVWQSASTDIGKASLTAIRALQSSDWLFAWPISASGLRFGDEAIRVAVGLRLRINICEPRACPCGTNVDARALHGLSCKHSAGRSTRHQQLNDLIWRTLKRADIPSTKEPTGLLRGDGKRTNGLTLVPLQAGKCLTWDATVVDTLTSSYVAVTATRDGEAADAATERKSFKYASLTNKHIFVPVTIETQDLVIIRYNRNAHANQRGTPQVEKLHCV